MDYQVCVIRDANAGLAGVELPPLAEFSDRGRAEEYASAEATAYELGCAVVDQDQQVIDWGGDHWTNYDGSPVNWAS